MKKLKKEIVDNPLYSQFIKENRIILSDINNQVTGLLQKTCENNSMLISLIEELLKLAEVSATIHNQYKNSTGDEEIYQLKSLLLNLKKNTMADSIYLETADYLVKKIDTLIAKSFTELDLTEKARVESRESNKLDLKKPEPELKYKWFTFSRNNSWFIIPFSEVNIIEITSEYMSQTDGAYFFMLDDTNKKIIDLMAQSPEKSIPPRFILQFNSTDRYFASDQNGREIYASSDIVSPLIKPLDRHRAAGYRGRVRIFGTKYLLPELNEEMPREQ